MEPKTFTRGGQLLSQPPHVRTVIACRTPLVTFESLVLVMLQNAALEIDANTSVHIRIHARCNARCMPITGTCSSAGGTSAHANLCNSPFASFINSLISVHNDGTSTALYDQDTGQGGALQQSMPHV